MVVEGLKKVAEVKRIVSHKVGKKVAGAEALTHLFYGGAVFTELRGELTIYAVAAITLGVVAVVGAIFGGDD